MKYDLVQNRTMAEDNNTGHANSVVGDGKEKVVDDKDPPASNINSNDDPSKAASAASFCR